MLEELPHSSAQSAQDCSRWSSRVLKHTACIPTYVRRPFLPVNAAYHHMSCFQSSTNHQRSSYQNAGRSRPYISVISSYKSRNVNHFAAYPSLYKGLYEHMALLMMTMAEGKCSDWIFASFPVLLRCTAFLKHFRTQMSTATAFLLLNTKSVWRTYGSAPR